MRRFDENPGLSMSGFFVAWTRILGVNSTGQSLDFFKKSRLFTFVKTFASGIVVNSSVASLRKRVLGNCSTPLFAFRPKCGGF
jgi:hypothetical protein